MDTMKSNQPDKKVKDKAGVGQTDEEKGIASPQEQKAKREELERTGKAVKKPQVNGQPDDDTSPDQP